MLELLYTSTKALDFFNPYGFVPGFMGFIESWDAMLLLNYQRLDKVFRDGTQVYLGSPSWNWSLGSRQGGRAIWFPYSTNPVSVYAADEITGQPRPEEILNPSWPIPFMSWKSGDCLDDLLGLFIHSQFGMNGPIKIFRLQDGYLLGQMPVTGASYDFLAPAGPGRVLACLKSSGQVALLDYVHQTWLWQGRVRPFLCACYDLHHNLVITLEGDKKIRVYLTTAAPATLAAPSFNPAVAQAHRLHGYKVKARLTGDGGEACPGYWIAWTLTGQPPKGYLDQPYSQTDQEGYAENYYFGPAAAGDIGSETIQVKAVI
jgi:hypothetical protein